MAEGEVLLYKVAKDPRQWLWKGSARWTTSSDTACSLEPNTQFKGTGPGKKTRYLDDDDDDDDDDDVVE